MVGNLADYVVSLNNGTVIHHGKPDETIEKDESFLEEAAQDAEAMEKADQAVDAHVANVKDDLNAGKLILAEEVEEVFCRNVEAGRGVSKQLRVNRFGEHTSSSLRIELYTGQGR